MKKNKSKRITVKKKVNGWVKFIEYMIEDCNTDIRDYTTGMEDYTSDGIDLDLIDDIKDIAVSINDLADRIGILADLHEEVVDDYKSINWRSYMISLLYKRDYMYEMLDYIDQTISPIGDDVINAMLNDAFGKEA